MVASVRQSSLPFSRTTLIGREHSLAELERLLVDPGVPLVTLTGPGGVGKTRLALASAESVGSHFDDVVFVPLAALRDPRLVIPAVAQALDVRDVLDQPLIERVRLAIGDRKLLLVLDNFEQVLDAATDLVSLLSGCRYLTVCVTSRALLHLTGEQAFPVPPLTLLDGVVRNTADDVARSGAGALFIARARAANPAFVLTEANAAEAAAICHRLDGLPLAIELAAARLSVLSPAALLARLDRRLPLLTGGARDLPARQRTMRDTIAWSYDLLSESERTLFRRLAVFAGGFSLDAVKVMCPDLELDPLDGVTSLVDKSLLRQGDEAGGEPRMQMLETIREFGLEQLDQTGELQATQGRHARYFLAVAERSEWAQYLPNGETLLERLGADSRNVFAALAWFAEQGDVHSLLGLAASLNIVWMRRGHFREAWSWLERAVNLGRARSDPALPKALIALGMLCHHAGGEARAQDLVNEGMRLANGSANWVVEFCGQATLGLITLRLNDMRSAAECQRRALDLVSAPGDEPWLERAACTILGHLGNIAVASGDIDGAEAYFDAALSQQQQMGFAPGTSHLFASHPIAGLGDVARARGDHAAALAAYQDALRLAKERDDRRAVLYALGGVAGTLAAAGIWKGAARLFGATESLHETLSIPFELETMDRQRALGLPEPWQRATGDFGAGTLLREALIDRPTVAIDRIPDIAMANRLWEEGRTLSLDAAANEAALAHLGADPLSAGLTRREHEVLRLVADGKTDAEIATALFVSRRTAATHVRNILGKLEVNSRAAAAATAVRLGLA